ncbi:hypothetical protein PIB30_104204, partial [Stylosanthes scabra]|nr:hypothetical protein [Stylosanthes scabra]
DEKHKAYVSWENEDDSSTISDKDEVTNICIMENEDEPSSDSNDEEIANICLMANEEKISDSNHSNFNLQDEYDALL